MKKIKVYSVTCFYFDENQFKNKKWTLDSQIRERRWGFYKEFDTALKCVEENWTDIYENGYYNYVLITEEHEGITSHHEKKEWWFKVDYQKNDEYKVELIKKSFFSKDMSFGFQKELLK